MLYTTGRLAKEAYACEKQYRKVSLALGGARKYGIDTPIPLDRILEIAGLDSAIWALRCVLPGQADERDDVVRLFVCDCAEHVLPPFKRERPEDSDAPWVVAMDAALAAESFAALVIAMATASDAEKELFRGYFLKRLQESPTTIEVNTPIGATGNGD